MSSQMAFWLVRRVDRRYDLGDRIEFVVRAESKADALREVIDENRLGDYVAEPLPVDGPTEVILSRPSCGC